MVQCGIRLGELRGLLLDPLLYRLERLSLLGVVAQEPSEADHLPVNIPCGSHTHQGWKSCLPPRLKMPPSPTLPFIALYALCYRKRASGRLTGMSM